MTKAEELAMLTAANERNLAKRAAMIASGEIDDMTVPSPARSPDFSQETYRKVREDTPEIQRKRAEAADRAQRAKIEDAISRSKIPTAGDIMPFVRAASIATPPALAAFATALEWWGVNGSGVVCVVSGGVGLAKTTSLCRCLVDTVDQGIGALFVEARTLSMTPLDGKTTRNEGARWIDYRETWEEWERVRVLGIDDCGTERGIDWFDLIEERFNDGHATLITTNLDAEQFATRYRMRERLRLLDRVINGQGHGGKPTGLPWFTRVEGTSLRNPKARDAFIASQATPTNAGTRH